MVFVKGRGVEGDRGWARSTDRVRGEERRRDETAVLILFQCQVIRSRSCSKASTLVSRLSSLYFPQMEQACSFGTQPRCGFMNNRYPRNTGVQWEVIIQQHPSAGMMTAISAGVPASTLAGLQRGDRHGDLGKDIACMQTRADSALLISNQLQCHL